jgi:signal transduction histidine kinase
MTLTALDTLEGESPARRLGAVVLAAASGAVLHWRRANPVAVLIVSLVLAVPYHLLVPEAVIPIAAMVSIWALTLARPPRVSLVGLAGLLAVCSLNFAATSLDDALFTIALAVSVWALAEVVRSRRAAIVQNAERAVRLEQDRIARELHDVIAHSVTVMVVQASAADEVFETRPDEARDAMRSIAEVGRATLSELRRLLNVVRPTDETPAAPQPGMSRVDELAAVARSAGLDVTVTQEGQPMTLPAGVDVSAYRIVQEALTNTLRHGNATRADVTVRYSPDLVDIDVIDNGRASSGRPPDGHGRGLVGMRQRAAVLGGAVETGPAAHGGFRVHARLPVNGSAAPAQDGSR